MLGTRVSGYEDEIGLQKQTKKQQAKETANVK